MKKIRQEYCKIKGFNYIDFDTIQEAEEYVLFLEEKLEDANQWVSVSERLPVAIIGFYDCLIIRNNKQVRQARFNALMQRFQNMNFEDIHDSVSHWLPLPSTDSINLK